MEVTITRQDVKWVLCGVFLALFFMLLVDLLVP